MCTCVQGCCQGQYTDTHVSCDSGKAIAGKALAELHQTARAEFIIVGPAWL